MECLEFRRQLAADPRTREDAFLAHRDSCHAGCTEAWWRAQRLERRLDNALQIDAPAQLAERVLLAHATGLRLRTRRRWRVGLALAASLVVVLGAGFMAWRGANAESLPQLAIAHMRGPEAFALGLTEPVPAASLRAGFAARGVTLRELPQNAVYVHDCPVGPYRTVHLVFREGGKPVTALYFPDHAIAEARDFRRSGVQVREVPLQHGTLMMLGDDAQGFAAVERTLDDALHGRAVALGRCDAGAGCGDERRALQLSAMDGRARNAAGVLPQERWLADSATAR
ncbi:MAG: DUF3379 family protein [Proteobacteria bacterium]|nr:DUF3379 family protein [Pseudomonadota bacterium]